MPTDNADLDPNVAAAKIQALARGGLARKELKDQRLWNAWNELDWKEESELMHSHQQIQELKANLTQQQQDKVPQPTVPSPSSESHEPVKDDHQPSPRSYTIKAKPNVKQSSAPTKEVEDDGLTLTDPIELDFVTAMMDHFKFNKMLDLENVVELLRRIKIHLKSLPNIVHINVTTRLTVVGDLHGQLDDLFAIFKLNGLPSPRNAYLFNGDFVDRGQYSVECVLTLFAFKLLYPKSMHLNRGNHEARDINSRDGFEKEVLNKYNHAVFDLFCDVFACLPIASVINDEIFVVHGGLAGKDFTLDELNMVHRFHEIPPTDSLMEHVIWSDPDKKKGRHSSPRGAGLLFGPDVTKKFLDINKLRLVIRSHECMQKGFEMHHHDTLITVFSASNYTGTCNNEGAFIIFERDLIPRIVPFFAKPKERLSRYRMRHAVMENDIIAKLLQRIADNRLALTNWYSQSETITSAGVRTVSRNDWAEGLKQVLKLNIPFLEFQDYLGLPKLGVDGKKKGDIDYMAFLLRFRPTNIILDRQCSHREIKENLEMILEMMHKNRYELQSLFRHFDLNGDEMISAKEFKEGIFTLQGILGFNFNENDIEALIEYIDEDHDGYISYSEFFKSFQVNDEQLAALLVLTHIAFLPSFSACTLYS